MYLIKNIHIVNENKIFPGDVLIKNGRIEKIAGEISSLQYAVEEINAEGKHLIPGMIDDQVHFREPGLTHKATIYSEARAAVAGGVTSFMEMPNTKPPAVTQQLLEDKYIIAANTALANYSFFMGATNDNIDELKKTDAANVCGIKVFMGSSTGNMLVDNNLALEKIYSECDNLIAIHSESEEVINRNLAAYREKYGDNIPIEYHPLIRNVEACYTSTQKAVALAKKHNTRLHILHISTEEELGFFDNTIPLSQKRITAEACVHHLWFDAGDYKTLGGLIKCNPAIKEARHKKAILAGLLNDKIDILATDHAPHTWDEKQGDYMHCPSGLPLVQHPLLMMFDFYRQGKISLEKIVEKAAHAPAECFKVHERGYIREGYKADLVLVDLAKKHTVSKVNIYYKCGWSPLDGHTFSSTIDTVFVNGNKVFCKGVFNENVKGERMTFREK